MHKLLVNQCNYFIQSYINKLLVYDGESTGRNILVSVYKSGRRVTERWIEKNLSI